MAAEPTVEPVPGRPTFSAGGLDDAPWCGPDDTGRVTGSVSVRLFVGRDTSRPVARDAVAAAQQVWARLGLEVVHRATDPLSTTAPTRLFNPAAGSAAGQVAPLGLLLEALPAIDEDVALVVISDFVEADTAVAALRGLTVPARGQAPDVDLPTEVWAAIPRRRYPVVLLDAAAGPRAPGDLSLTPAHELGHALGLPHRREAEALMSSGTLSLRCLPGLSVGEAATLSARVRP